MGTKSLSMNYSLHNSRHSGESRNPVLSRPSGCRIESGMTNKAQALQLRHCGVGATLVALNREAEASPTHCSPG